MMAVDAAETCLKTSKLNCRSCFKTYSTNLPVKGANTYLLVKKLKLCFIMTRSTDDDYPFELRAVQKDGLSCSWCPWYRFCRGCPIPCNDQLYTNRSSFLAIEWDPTTLHLRYQSSLEKTFTEHESVEKSRKLQTEPIDLYECLSAFTKEEELGEDELW